MNVRFSPLVVFSAAAFSLFSVGEVSAQEKQGKRDFKAFDANNDGRISPGEWKLKAQSRDLSAKQMVERFKAIDTDGDGFISADEMGKWTQKSRKGKKKAQAREGKEIESEKARQEEEAAKAKQAKKEAKKAKKAQAK